ncbi:MAG: FAD-binding oxidoreductase [Candidatus Andersenbacteria bacterium]
MTLVEELHKIMEGEVDNSDAALTTYSRDASLFSVRPQVVVYPKTVADMQRLIHYVADRPDQNLSLTIRSGGTCMSGGSINESIIVDVNRHLHHIQSVQDFMITTQPGAFYRDFEKKTLEHGLLMPSYPASREICTVGGMVNNNAGGEKTLAYGKTERYVKQLKVLLRDGKEYTLEALNRHELDMKMQQDDLEGDIYRRMYALLEDNFNAIQTAKPHVTKDSTGYHLWNVWDRRTFDLSKLFVGSQGTLGITSEITFRLIHPKPHSTMLVIFLRDISALAQIVKTVLRYTPESFESYDDHTLSIALKYFPQMLKQMGGNVFTLGLRFLPELKLLVTGGLPKLILLAEFTGPSKDEVQRRAHAARAALQSFDIKTRVTKNAAEAKKYWVIRHESFNLLRNKVKDKHTAPFIDDLTVRAAQLPQFLPRLDEILSRYDITYTVAGHIGDANFHIIPLMDLTDPKQRDIIPKLAKEVYDLVFEFHGSMSGEHNDGLIRSPFLKQMYGEQIYELFAETKRIFDPDNMFNPNKKIGTTLEYAMEHLARD